MTVRRAGHGSEGELVRVGQGRGTREDAQVGEYMCMDGCVRGAWIGIEVGRVRRVMKPMVQVERQSARGGGRVGGVEGKGKSRDPDGKGDEGERVRIGGGKSCKRL